MRYSIEADVTPAFAWRYRTDVATWNDPPAKFALDGPFATGSQGTTLLPGQDPLHWRIGEITPGKSFVLEMPLDRAMLSFEWRFEELPGQRTKLTQDIMLSGENRESYAAQVEAGFGANLADGMNKLAVEIAEAEKKLDLDSRPGGRQNTAK